MKCHGRMNLKNFVRERVLTFPVLISFLINLAKKSLQVSLNEFCKMSELACVTKQAFSKARKKLSPKAFVLLNRKLVEECYTDNTYSTWKGYRVIAIDGSDMQLPQIENIKTQFGTAKNHKGSTLAMSKISYAYDVLNNITLDAQISRCKDSERDLAVKHIEEIQKLNHDKTRDLYIFDRGYPSLWLLFYLLNQKVDFLIRTSECLCFQEVKQALSQGENDVIIRLYANEASKKQVKALKSHVPGIDREMAYVDIRVVVVALDTGENEILITSLLDQTIYPKEELKVLYNQRWGIEENYKWHKLCFELENFSGYTKLAIEQEFFALVFTANMASLLIQEAEQEIQEEHKLKPRKHVYKINRRVAIATLKDRLIKGILDPEIDIQVLCQDLKAELKKNLCPVRPNRRFKRPQKLRLKHGCSTRRCV